MKFIKKQCLKFQNNIYFNKLHYTLINKNFSTNNVNRKNEKIQISEHKFSSISDNPDKPNFKNINNLNTLILKQNYTNKIIVNPSKDKILLFYSKLPISDVIVSNFTNILPVLFFGICAKLRPFYIDFPVFLLICNFSIFYYLIIYFDKVRIRRNIVKEIWLDKNTLNLTFVYNNSKTREKYGERSEIVIPLIQMKSPKHKFFYEPFPENDIEAKMLKGPNNLKNQATYNSYWIKYYKTHQTFFLMYKDSMLINMDILKKVFNGEGLSFKDNIEYVIEGNPNNDKLTVKNIEKAIVDFNNDFTVI